MGIGDIAAGIAARAVYGDAEDIDIRERARSTAAVVISSETDFGTLLAFQRATSPSVLTREVSTRPTGGLVKLLLADLDTIAEALEKGAVVVLSRPEIRRPPTATALTSGCSDGCTPQMTSPPTIRGS